MLLADPLEKVSSATFAEASGHFGKETHPQAESSRQPTSQGPSPTVSREIKCLPQHLSEQEADSSHSLAFKRQPSSHLDHSFVKGPFAENPVNLCLKP